MRSDRAPIRVVALLVAVSACLLTLPASAASFQVIDSPWGVPGVLGMSADGSTLVGTLGGSSSSFVWRSDIGVQRIQPLNTDYLTLSQLWDVTPDGGIAVGSTDIPCCSRLERVAAVWTDESGWSPLPASTGFAFPFRYNATAISDDGRIIVGHHQPHFGQDTPVMWVDGVEQIPDGLPIGSTPWDISADGSVIVGAYTHLVGDLGTRDAFVWSASGGFINLTTESGECCDSAWAVSADGTVVIGTARHQGTDRAFRWSSGDGLSFMAMPEGFVATYGSDVTGDGRIIVGTGLTTAAVATIWDQEHGTRLLQDVLTNDLHIGLDGWRLTEAGAVSRDGRFVAGQAIDPHGRKLGYIADLTPVPAPPAVWLLGTGLVGLGGRHWLRWKIRI